MSNPFYAPRPNPFSLQLLENGWTLDELLERRNLRSHLQDNAEWLCHSERSSQEIYRALFSRVDPSGSRIKDGTAYINELMWELGYRPVGEKQDRVNTVWKWEEAT